MDETGITIDRHKTAIRRTGFSLPITCLLRDELLQPNVTVFDYGCGRGQDLELLAGLQLQCDGWTVQVAMGRIQSMNDADAKYGIALPNMPQFTRMWGRLPGFAGHRTTV
jgi:hypothetical protein